jgi:hypothetical protein
MMLEYDPNYNVGLVGTPGGPTVRSCLLADLILSMYVKRGGPLVHVRVQPANAVMLLARCWYGHAVGN